MSKKLPLVLAAASFLGVALLGFALLRDNTKDGVTAERPTATSALSSPSKNTNPAPDRTTPTLENKRLLLAEMDHKAPNWELLQESMKSTESAQRILASRKLATLREERSLSLLLDGLAQADSASWHEITKAIEDLTGYNNFSPEAPALLQTRHDQRRIFEAWCQSKGTKNVNELRRLALEERAKK